MSVKRILLLGVFFMRAAVAGDDPELTRLYEEKNYKQLLERFKKITEGRATNAGYSLSEIASAKYNIGVMYQQGLGTPKDLEKALQWYEKAAVGGDARAQYNLGLMHYTGEGTQQDFSTAAHWLAKSADQGFADAESQLGDMYDAGEGVKQDHIFASALRQRANAHRQELGAQ
jgi:TPR repeat protein